MSEASKNPDNEGELNSLDCLVCGGKMVKQVQWTCHNCGESVPEPHEVWTPESVPGSDDRAPVKSETECEEIWSKEPMPEPDRDPAVDEDAHGETDGDQDMDGPAGPDHSSGFRDMTVHIRVTDSHGGGIGGIPIGLLGLKLAEVANVNETITDTDGSFIHRIAEEEFTDVPAGMDLEELGEKSKKLCMAIKEVLESPSPENTRDSGDSNNPFQSLGDPPPPIVPSVENVPELPCSNRCQSCNRMVGGNWELCAYCGSRLYRPKSAKCLKCGKTVKSNWTICAYCGENL